MSLNDVWFILIGVLFTGFFFLEGFDYGVGILLPFLGKTDDERRAIINSIGPFWDANEVWLIVAGGAMFAAFPNWYATLFSGFYLALLLVLVALILRGAAFEFRSKGTNPLWRRLWDWLIFVGSLLPALLFGVAMSNLLIGTPIDAQMTFQGNLLTLLNPLALLAGLASLLGFVLHGAIFLSLKIEGELAQRAYAVARTLWLPVLVVVSLALLLMYFLTDMAVRLGYAPLVVPLLAIGALYHANRFINRRRLGWAFALLGLTILLSTATLFMGLYPRVMVSSLNPEWSLTIHNAASSEYTLRVMSIVALTLVPIVLAYQAWNYWVFRQRVGTKSSLHY
jgi:cytochrome d ubiquinol oxidase subunit II